MPKHNSDPTLTYYLIIFRDFDEVIFDKVSDPQIKLKVSKYLIQTYR
jgi:hypothetical protein